MTPASDILTEAFRFEGVRYVFGAEIDNKSPGYIGPVDCSELVQHACLRAGVVPTMPDGAYWQWLHTSRNSGRKGISLEKAYNTPGALLFIGDGTGVGRDAISHVAISLGDGTHTIEARGSAWPVGIFPEVYGRRWNFAALIPGVDHSVPPIERPPLMANVQVVLDLSGIISHVDLAYEAAGRSKDNDPKGRLYWVEMAAKSDDPWAILAYMESLLGLT